MRPLPSLILLYRCGADGVKEAARAADDCNISYLYTNYRYFLVNICIYAAFSGGAGIFGIKCKYLTVCIFARRSQLLTLLNPFPSECAAGGLPGALRPPDCAANRHANALTAIFRPQNGVQPAAADIRLNICRFILFSRRGAAVTAIFAADDNLLKFFH